MSFDWKLAWRSFALGFSSVLGVAPVRRHVPTPAEVMAEIEADLGRAIAEAKRKRGDAS